MAGHYDFAHLETLTATLINDYLMDQAFRRFPSEVERDAAIGEPEAGHVCFVVGLGPMFWNGQQWQSFIPAIDVGEFGAVGDGVTDDTFAIQDALDFAFEHGGGIVRLQPFTYLISRPLFVQSGITLEGQSAGATKILQSDAFVSAIYLDVSGNPDLLCSNVSIHDMSFVGSEAAVGTGTGSGILGPGDAHHLSIQNVAVSDFSIHGLYMLNTENSMFQNVRCSGNGTHGFLFWGYKSLHLDTCVAVENGSHGFGLNGDAWDSLNHSSMTSCRSLNNTGIGYSLVYATGMQLTGCSSDGGTTGFNISASVWVGLSGCTAANVSTGGFHVASESRFVTLTSCVQMWNSGGSYGIQVDSDCSATLIECNPADLPIITSGSVNVISCEGNTINTNLAFTNGSDDPQIYMGADGTGTVLDVTGPVRVSVPSVGDTSFYSVGQTQGDTAISGRASGDTYPAFSTTNNGHMKWGSGAGATDTDLYRHAAGKLASDSLFLPWRLGNAGYQLFAGLSLGSLTGWVRWHDANGNTVGYLPLYSSIS